LNGYGFQIANPITQTQLWFRYQSNNSWGTWAQVATQNIDNTFGTSSAAIQNTQYVDASHSYRFYYGTTQIGDIGAVDTTWLRINQNTAKNIYTPRMIRADGGLQILGANASSAASPGITFADDTNTGFYWLGADRLGVATGGVKAAEFTTSTTTEIYVGTTSSGLFLQRSASGAGYVRSLDNNLNLGGSNTDVLYLTSSILQMNSGKTINCYPENTTDKIRLWNNSAYAIGMDATYTYGGLNDYAITFTMSNTAARGWIFRDTADAKSTGAMSLTTTGIMQIAGAFTAAGNITANSDVRLKENLNPFVNIVDVALNVSKGIRRFDWKEEYCEIERPKQDFGVIAQHTLGYAPEIISVTRQHDMDILSVDYGKMSVLALGLSADNRDLIEDLQARIKELEEKWQA
jgi:hypothetical protein